MIIHCISSKAYQGFTAYQGSLKRSTEQSRSYDLYRLKNEPVLVGSIKIDQFCENFRFERRIFYIYEI